ncbi:glycine betaine/proline transport system substrate-binding protein [Virgibacillus natechei]|uniref:Glycine betaine/proline transport system substrate-binding protein n=1 Tax=Virgibacillus natechei TaxID=1216297 RepID=A0ABS4IIS0_9BACI|nr:glycine betaine ABC transporter substrate-binding protein [Virgibacillus natechei]MBP1970816.1 glycine betaine/proline transport system substrate-binding protein [Virgibacillus natechei]UZD12291.1 glycine/betaine ABC transporter [Virgibacillus natechei]
MISLSKKWGILVSISIVLLLVGCQEETSGNAAEETNDAAEIEEIVGIEPGSGTMNIAEETMEEYDLSVELTPSSEAAMLSELERAIESQEPIVVTLWQPHWSFREHDLKFLEDPKETLGASENIHTMVREGLEDEQISAYQLLDNFYWEIEDMNKVMSNFRDDDVEPREAAAEWIENNRDEVDAWIEDIEAVEDETIELAYVNWDTETASTNVVALVLEELGYDVELTMVDMGVAFQALSSGDVDGMLIAWLPVGAASYYEEYQDEIVDLGPNLEGAQQGFVVPEYMDIDSIEDLPTN